MNLSRWRLSRQLNAVGTGQLACYCFCKKISGMQSWIISSSHLKNLQKLWNATAFLYECFVFAFRPSAIRFQVFEKEDLALCHAFLHMYHFHLRGDQLHIQFCNLQDEALPKLRITTKAISPNISSRRARITSNAAMKKLILGTWLNHTRNFLLNRISGFTRFARFASWPGRV